MAPEGADRPPRPAPPAPWTGRFLAAVQSGNGDLACAQLQPGSVARVRVYVNNAIVELSSGEAEFLAQGKQGWRLSAVGCTPKGGKPRDEPYDCELED